MKKSIELTEKQGLILWMLFSWFQEDFKRTGLMTKLYYLTGENFRREHRKQCEKIILKRIVELGEWIKNKHPEFLV